MFNGQYLIQDHYCFDFKLTKPIYRFSFISANLSISAAI